MKQEAARGSITTIASQAIQFVLATCGTIVLARLLTPTDYGLIGMATAVTGFATMFRDAGLSMATIQAKNITEELVSTLFWINAGIGGILAVLVVASAPLLAAFYDRPELLGVTAALATTFLLIGATIQHSALLRRKLSFLAIAGIQIAAQTANFLTAAALAWLGFRYWALVSGAIAAAICTVVLTYCACPWVPGRPRRAAGVRPMLGFGGHLAGFNVVNYFSRNLDNILIGKFIGAGSLGLYAKAYQMFMLPITQIREPLNQVAMPVMSALRGEPERFVRYYRRLVESMATLAVPLTLYCAFEADFLIEFLLGPKWGGCVPVFRVLAVAGLVQAVASTRGLVLVSSGLSRRYLTWGLVNAAASILAFVVGLPFGIVGVATAYTVVNYLILIPSLFFCFSGTPVKVRVFFEAVAPPLLAGGLASGVFFLVGLRIRGDSLGRHAILGLLFGLTYVLVTLSRSSVRETLQAVLASVVPGGPLEGRRSVGE